MLGALSLDSADFISNTARVDGGGVYAGGTAALASGQFQGNACTQDGCWGGGLFALSGLTLTGTQFINNTARASAGGAYANAGAAAVLYGGLFQGNQCTQAACQGGGVTVTNGMFYGNAATRGGGLGRRQPR